MWNEYHVMWSTAPEKRVCVPWVEILCFVSLSISAMNVIHLGVCSISFSSHNTNIWKPRVLWTAGHSLILYILYIVFWLGLWGFLQNLQHLLCTVRHYDTYSILFLTCNSILCKCCSSLFSDSMNDLSMTMKNTLSGVLFVYFSCSSICHIPTKLSTNCKLSRTAGFTLNQFVKLYVLRFEGRAPTPGCVVKLKDRCRAKKEIIYMICKNLNICLKEDVDNQHIKSSAPLSLNFRTNETAFI